jgi:hypothetical protein
VCVITLNDDEALINCAQPIVAELRANMVRVDADFSATRFKAKISNAEHREGFPPPHVGGYGWSSAVAIGKRGKFPCAFTTAARKARSRRRKSWRKYLLDAHPIEPRAAATASLVAVIGPFSRQFPTLVRAGSGAVGVL